MKIGQWQSFKISDNLGKTSIFIQHRHSSTLLFRDPLFSTRAGIIVRKDYLHAEKIDNELMWLEALGLSAKLQSWEKREHKHGIWAPDAGPCKEKGTRKGCKLPSGSKFYSWAERDKERPNC